MAMSKKAALAALEQAGWQLDEALLRPLPGGFAALLPGSQPSLALLSQGRPDLDRLWSPAQSQGGKGLRLLPLNANNAALVRRYVAGCSPKALGNGGTSLGFCDLLGCNPLAAAPVLAGKNLRPCWVDVKAEEAAAWDLNLLTPMDRATWAVLGAGYSAGYGAAAVLSSEEELVRALLYGYSSIGLDLGAKVDGTVPELSPQAVEEGFAKLPEAFRAALAASYLQSEFDAAGYKLRYSQEGLSRIILAYGQALMYSQYIYETYLQGAPWPLDFELDFSAMGLSPAAHYLIAKELERNGVRLSCLTLDAARLASSPGDLEAHCRIASFFNHRLGLDHADTALADPGQVRQWLQGRVHFRLNSLAFSAALATACQAEPTLYAALCRALGCPEPAPEPAALPPEVVENYSKALAPRKDLREALGRCLAARPAAAAACLAEGVAAFVKKL